MSYTAPAYNAVDFNKTGVAYTAPGNSAVDFQWGGGVPTFSFISKSTPSFRAGSMFSLAGGSSAVFHNPYRSFQIASGSATDFVTWQRAFSFQSGSTPAFRPGSIASIFSGASVAVVGHGLVRADYAISTGSVVDGRDQWIFNSALSTQSRTVARFSGAYNKDMAMRISSDSALSMRSSAVKRVVFSMPSGAPCYFRSAIVRRPAFSLVGGSSMTMGAAALACSSFSINSQASLSLQALAARGGAASISSSSLLSFVSSYDFSTVREIPDDADVVYCTAKADVVRVVTL